MKTGIHPRYETTTVTCACGNVFETRSTRQNLRIDLCSVCHPFYTGEQRIVDTAGQVERFTKKMERAAEGSLSKRQQRINAKATQVADEKRRQDEATASARAAQRERARVAAENRAALEAQQAESAEASEATADAIETEAAEANAEAETATEE